MNRCLVAAAVWAALSASSAGAQDSGPAQRYGDWGFDTAAMDFSVKPGDDFYRYAEGKAVDAMQIPADRSRFGSFDALAELSDARSREIIEKAAATTGAKGEAAQVGAFYRAFMDQALADRLDAAPMARELAAIRAADSHDAVAALMGRANAGFGAGVFDVGIQADAKAPDRYVVHLGQDGLGLPDRDYYLQPSFAEKTQQYQAYIAQTLGMIGWSEPQADAAAIVAMESRIADAKAVRS